MKREQQSVEYNIYTPLHRSERELQGKVPAGEHNQGSHFQTEQPAIYSSQPVTNNSIVAISLKKRDELLLQPVIDLSTAIDINCCLLKLRTLHNSIRSLKKLKRW